MLRGYEEVVELGDVLRLFQSELFYDSILCA